MVIGGCISQAVNGGPQLTLGFIGSERSAGNEVHFGEEDISKSLGKGELCQEAVDGLTDRAGSNVLVRIGFAEGVKNSYSFTHPELFFNFCLGGKMTGTSPEMLRSRRKS